MLIIKEKSKKISFQIFVEIRVATLSVIHIQLWGS